MPERFFRCVPTARANAWEEAGWNVISPPLSMRLPRKSAIDVVIVEWQRPGHTALDAKVPRSRAWQAGRLFLRPSCGQRINDLLYLLRTESKLGHHSSVGEFGGIRQKLY